MLELEITVEEGYDETLNLFTPPICQTLRLEHSLISISKWESIWHKPFLANDGLSFNEQLSYIKCMTINKVDEQIYKHLTKNEYDKISKYIEDPMTATTFSSKSASRSREVITSEIIYYWMVALQIPYEFEKWHLNRLLTLIRVCNIKNEPAKMMSKRDLLSRNSALNASRRKRYNTKG